MKSSYPNNQVFWTDVFAEFTDPPVLDRCMPHPVGSYGPIMLLKDGYLKSVSRTINGRPNQRTNSEEMCVKARFFFDRLADPNAAMKPADERLANLYCWTKFCVNPNHLYWYFDFDQERQDMITSLLGHNGRKKHSHQHLRKLTDAQVKEIRHRYNTEKTLTQAELAKEFGVSVTTVSRILVGSSYQDVE